MLTNLFCWEHKCKKKNFSFIKKGWCFSGFVMNIEKKDLSRSVKTYLNEIASKFSYLELFGNTKNDINVVFMHFIFSFRNMYLIIKIFTFS